MTEFRLIRRPYLMRLLWVYRGYRKVGLSRCMALRLVWLSR